MTTVNDVRDLRTIWGMWVRCLLDFPNVPVGSLGIIDEIYKENDGVIVAWNFDDSPLPKGYPIVEYSRLGRKRTPQQLGLTRDGFGHNELIYLEILGTKLLEQG